MEIEIYIHSDECDHCSPSFKFLTAVLSTLKTDKIKLKVHQVEKNKETAINNAIPINQLPVIVLPSGCKITGSLSHELIGTLVCSLLTGSKVPVQSSDKFDIDSKDASLLIELASAMIEYQAAYTIRRDRAYTFIIKESTKNVPLERYKELAQHTKIMLLTNFDERPDIKLYELGLDKNVFLGHIFRDNMVMAANLIIWRDRANHVTYFRLKRTNSKYTGECSTLLGDGKKTIKTFFKPLFMTASTINNEGHSGEGQNRIVASVKEVSTDLNRLLKK